jgi:hypothetical protein
VNYYRKRVSSYKNPLASGTLIVVAGDSLFHDVLDLMTSILLLRAHFPCF